MPQPTPTNIIILGAGVAGLTTAHALLSHSDIQTQTLTIIAKHLPGDIHQTEYCSPQAGANWHSFETELNAISQFDKVAFERFVEIARNAPESGVKRFPLRLVYGVEDESQRNGIWFEDLVGGIVDVPVEEVPEGTWGVEMNTFIFNPVVYLGWLYASLLKRRIRIMRRSYAHVDDIFSDYPDTTALFNCTGLGARDLGGVEDETVHPIKGQTILLSEPKTPLKRMYVWSQPSIMGLNEFSHVFPRPLGGGVIIGGIKRENDWDESFDFSREADIKKRACQLAPELGRPEDLQVVRYNVGLRPSRKGGPRVEIEERKGKFLVHNYGAGGAGYQSSWGMAEHAVALFAQKMELQQAKL